ncbi:MAG: asparagine synthase (glutamine-hydrolyzing) [Acidobacteriaceae bacterium]|nr:asparagine synthase (glutamine-hydrolyzing) [Acidobacteriaceae bacterium]
MCGIFGWVVRSSQRQSPEQLSRLTDMMAHRGPDGHGQWIGDTHDGRFQVGLGHRRLAIIDLVGGQQPMWSADGSIGLITNGEIYNYIELRAELQELGFSCRTDSDTEVMIEAYRAWGVDAIKRFRGMFAFALWDVKRERLVLGRDAFGKKPLFLASGAQALVFGSEIEPLTRFPGFDRSLDPDALAHYFLNRYVPGPLTFFRHVKKLQPGHYAVWQNGKMELTRYFTAPFAATDPDILDFNQAVSLFSATFDDAVRIRMRSDAPYGAYLSGGIDSSAVVATMTRHSSQPIRTFSVGFSETQYSELDEARLVAAEFNCDHHELVVEPQAFMESWPNAVLRRGAPVTEASDIPILMLSRMASSTVKMVLTGEGADELMAGYPKHKAERWVELYQRVIPQALHDQLVSPAIRALPYTMRRLKIFIMAAGERHREKRMKLWFGGMSDLERDKLLGRTVRDSFPDDHPFSARISSNLRRTLFFDQTSWLPDNLLERGDRMMMAGSIEGRMPFMDTELAALVARFPDEFLAGHKGGKAVLRAAMATVLPEKILNRKKIGFRVPFNEWFRGPYSGLLRDLLTSDASQVATICDPKILHVLVREHIEGTQNHERVLWSLSNLEMFLRAFRPSGIEAGHARAAA